MITARRHHRPRIVRASFTLVELMISISIIAIMASMVLFAVYSAQEAAKVDKTKHLIGRLDSIIKGKWDAYRTRRVPVTVPAGTGGAQAGLMRLAALHDLMRMEMPDRWSDVLDDPVVLPFSGGFTINRPAVSQAYLRRYTANVPTGTNAGAECLYLIVMSSMAEEGDAREVFKPDDVKDTDGDGYPEFVDAWGQPIKFLRWAPGFQDSDLQVAIRYTASEATSGGSGVLQVSGIKASGEAGAYLGGALLAVSTVTTNGAFDLTLTGRVLNYTVSAGGGQFTYDTTVSSSLAGPIVATNPYQFDTIRAIVASATGVTPEKKSAPTFALYPLIYSAGPDKCFGVLADFGGLTGALRYSITNCPINPQVAPSTVTVFVNPFHIADDPANSIASMIGTCRDDSSESNYVSRGWLDNIHNHTTLSR